jgi:hypothetical protein
MKSLFVDLRRQPFDLITALHRGSEDECVALENR